MATFTQPPSGNWRDKCGASNPTRAKISGAMATLSEGRSLLSIGSTSAKLQRSVRGLTRRKFEHLIDLHVADTCEVGKAP